jgi:hypothetical protein
MPIAPIAVATASRLLACGVSGCAARTYGLPMAAMAYVGAGSVPGALSLGAGATYGGGIEIEVERR